MKTIFLFLLLFSISNSQEWTKLNGPKGKGELRQAVAKNDSIFIITYDSLLVSTDKGKNWSNFKDNIKRKVRDFHSLNIIGDTLFLCVSPLVQDSVNEEIYYRKLGDSKWNKINFSERFFSFESIFKYNNNYFINASFDGFIYNDKLEGKWSRFGNYDERPNRCNEILFFGDSIITGSKIVRDNFGNVVVGGVLFSTNKGKSWEKRIKGLNDISVNSLQTNHDVIYCGTDDGLYISKDFGENWTKINFFSGKTINNLINFDNQIAIITKYNGVYTLKDSTITKIEYFNEFNQPLFSFLQDGKLYFTTLDGIIITDDLDTFEKIIYKNDIVTFDMIYSDSSTYFSTYQNGLFKYNLKEDKFTNVNDSLYKISKSLYKTFKKDSNIFSITYMRRELLFSSDNGKNWKNINLDFTYFNDTFYDVEFINDRFVVSSNWEKFYSSDNGETWKKFKIEGELESYLFNILSHIEKYNNLLYLYGPGLATYNINTNEVKILIDTATFNKEYSNIRVFRKYDDFSIFFDDKKGLVYSTDEINWKKVNLPTGGTIFDLERYKNNIFIKSTAGVYQIDTDFKESKEINFNLSENFIDYGSIIIIKDKLYCFTKGVYFIPLEDLGIEYTSVEKTAETIPGDCYTLKEVEFYDVIGNKLSKEEIYNKRIIVKYKCLETGNFQYKLEYRVR